MIDQWWGNIGNMTIFRYNNYETIRHLWKGVAVKNKIYVMEIISLEERDLNGLETTRNKMTSTDLGH